MGVPEVATFTREVTQHLQVGGLASSTFVCSASPQLQAGPVFQHPEASKSLTTKLSRPLFSAGVALRARRQADRHATNRSKNLGQHPRQS